MKKRMLSVAVTLAIVCCMFCNAMVNVNAEESSLRQVEGSYLTTQESSTATTYNPLLRGTYLMDGDTTISKAGLKKVFVYAATTANTTVDKVAVNVFVEEYIEEEDNWSQIDCWTVEKDSDYYVSTQKTVYVDGGSYYRAWSEHFAGNRDENGVLNYETAITVTDGIWVN